LTHHHLLVVIENFKNSSDETLQAFFYSLFLNERTSSPLSGETLLSKGTFIFIEFLAKFWDGTLGLNHVPLLNFQVDLILGDVFDFNNFVHVRVKRAVIAVFLRHEGVELFNLC